MEFAHYVGVLRRGWATIAIAVLLGVGGGWLFNFASEDVYASTARVFVTTPLQDSSVSGAYQGNLFTERRVDSYADLVRTDVLAERVAQTLGDGASPTDLADKVDARVIPNTVMIDVTATASTSEEAQAVADAYGEEFIALIRELETPPDGQPLVSASIVNSPEAPAAPVSPADKRNLALGAFLGGFLGLGFVLLRDALDSSVTLPEHAERAGLPVMATIADRPAAAKSPISSGSERSPYAESFRQLRTNLHFMHVDKPVRSVVVTSAVAGEGKTLVAVNLAVVLGELGQRVILVDADLRRPRVAAYTGLIGEAGLANVLIGDVGVKDVLQPFADNVDVLASGPVPPNPTQLLQSNAMTALVEALESEADTVVIDAPPLLPVTDAAVLSTICDGTLTVVRYGRTRRDQLVDAVESLNRVGARVLGAVVNMAPAKKKRGYGGYYG